MKKLYRSDTNKIFAGIIGGLGEYFNVDPTVLRLLWVILLLVTGVLPCLVAYLIALFIVPKKPSQQASA